MLFICYYLKTKNIYSIHNVFLGQKKSFEWFSLLRMPHFRCILASYCSYARHIYTISGITPCPGKPSEPSSATSQNTFWLYSSTSAGMNPNNGHANETGLSAGLSATLSATHTNNEFRVSCCEKTITRFIGVKRMKSLVWIENSQPSEGLTSMGRTGSDREKMRWRNGDGIKNERRSWERVWRRRSRGI